MYIARRLRLAPSDGGRRSPAVGIAIAGVALAVVVMMASVSIVLGFQEAIRQKVMGFEASVTIRPLGKYYRGEATEIEFTPVMRQAVSEAVPSGRIALAVSQPAVLKAPDSFAGVVLNGFGQGHDSSFERGNLLEGTLPEKGTDVLLSVPTASKLSLGVGDKVDACFFVNGSMKLRRLTVCGVYSSNFSDYDRITAYADYGMLCKLRGLGENVGDFVEIRGVEAEEIPDASAAVQQALTRLYYSGELPVGVSVSTVFDSGAMYFNWLALLDANVVVILVIMVLVSGFTLISCVFILILQRVRMIGVLKSLGATDGQIRRVFMFLGGRVVGLGLLAGNLVGLSLLYLQTRFHMLSLDPEAYFLTYVPVRIDWVDIAALNVGAAVLAGMLMLVPAALVSRISPARTMHYE